MSLAIESNNDCCSLSMNEILMRVANIKARWSDEEREFRAEQGRYRRQGLEELLGARSCRQLDRTLLESLEEEGEDFGFSSFSEDETGA
jgi:hypothetical protein